ncbi:Histidinol-phosphate aminotransferase [hydrothermal vent metagenome]|uniref:Histidinol-phosphate aminotransferase n=1 Tax=hydrothermal vent metagenome TaxID=652676 RepID=A0A3B1CAD3_9ZZZZ
MNPSDFVRPRVKQLSAYHVDPIPADVVLDANESSYPLPQKLHERLVVLMAGTELNRYPDPDSTYLKRAIAKKEGARETEILLGNGSDEVIQTLISAVCDPGDKILTMSPTFSMYKQIATYLNVETVEVPLNEKWDIDYHEVLGAIDEHEPKIIFIATPNNPTGGNMHRDSMAAIMNFADGLVVIDEAYVDYSDKTAALLYQERPNVAVLKTLSKVGMAAIRLGYMMADERLIEEVNKTRLPYNINSLTQAVATELLKNWDQLKPMFDATKKERRRVMTALYSVKKITPNHSDANFIFFKLDGNPEEFFNFLLDNGVRIRWFNGNKGLENCFRVTIGRPAENDRFLSALEKLPQ